MESTILTFYKFLPLADPEGLRPELKRNLAIYGAKGTVLLSPEGVNGSVAIPLNFAEPIKDFLQSSDYFGPLNFKEHTPKSSPFRRLLVRLKKEIITFRVPGLNPAQAPAPHLPPHTLKEWYDSGKDMILLDTRNEFEIKFGAFEKAQSCEIRHFTEFAEAAKKLPESYKEKTIVTYCTGGIRCEKAAPFLQNLGFKDVYQLDGGILNYFKECGGDHYSGECFVFDHRVAVNAKLEETTTSYCVLCQTPIHDPRIKELFTVKNRYCSQCRPKANDK